MENPARGESIGFVLFSTFIRGAAPYGTAQAQEGIIDVDLPFL